MKFQIHPCNPDGTPDLSRARAVPDPEHPSKLGEVVDHFPNLKQAQVALIEALRLQQIPGAYADYHIQAYDDQGTPVAFVDPKDVEDAAADARSLAQYNQEVQLAMAAMLAGRQIYAFAVQELDKLLGTIHEIKVLDAPVSATADAVTPEPKTHTEDRPPHPLAVEVLIQSVANRGNQAFDPTQLLEGMGQIVLPWMHNHLKQLLVAQEEYKNKAIEAAKAARKAHRVPIGIPLDKGLDGRLDRTKGLVLVGYGPAVRYLLDYAVNTALAVRDEDHPNKVLSVIRFCEQMPQASQHERLARMPRKLWERISGSDKVLGQLLHDHIFNQMRTLQDLVVADDLTGLGRDLSAGRRQDHEINAYRAADGCKMLLKWAKHSGFALLAGVPSPTEKPVGLREGAWEHLRSQVTVRSVTVIRKACPQAPDLAEGKVRLIVGKDAFFVDVAPEAIAPPNVVIV